MIKSMLHLSLIKICSFFMWLFFFFFNDTATTEIYTLSLHDALPISQQLFERAIAFREALARVLLARTEGRAPANEDLRLIDAEYAHTARFARLSSTAEGFAWSLEDRKSTRLNSSHSQISYAVFCLKK